MFIDYGFLIDLASGFIYNFMIIIGIIIGCIIASNNKNGLPVFWIFFALQLFSVIGIIIQINRGEAYSTLYFYVVIFVLLSIVGVCLVSTVKKKAAEREANKKEDTEPVATESKPQEEFVCRSCNNTFTGWYKECPRCHSIDTMERIKDREVAETPPILTKAPQQEIKEETPKMIETTISVEPSQQMFFCRKCGARIPADSAFCPKCGEKVIDI